MEYLNPKAFAASIVYSLLGIVILVVSFYLFNKLTPGTLRKEIIEDHNNALAILGPSPPRPARPRPMPGCPACCWRRWPSSPPAG